MFDRNKRRTRKESLLRRSTTIHANNVKVTSTELDFSEFEVSRSNDCRVRDVLVLHNMQM